MIVVAIIALLAALAIPSFAKARTNAKVAKFCNDLRVISDAVQQYTIDHGDYPPDSYAGCPTGMETYVPKNYDWSRTPLGGAWDWDKNVVGVKGGLSVIFGGWVSASPEFKAVDERIDDGNLSTGSFILNGDRYTYILEK